MKKRWLLWLLLPCLLLAGCKGETPTPPADPEVPPLTPVVLPQGYGEQFAPEKDGIYNYCPAVTELADGTRYMYYCTNQNSHEVIDYIGCRKGTPNADGTYTWGREQIVLSPSVGGWDGHHTCDPSVVAGEFAYNGENYGYLMAYLGCTSYDNQENKIGLAVAKTPEGPFLRVGDTPLIDFQKDADFEGFQWGVGQPSLISLDKKGKVLLFYTRGDKDGTRLMADTWALSDLNAPARQGTETVGTASLCDLNGNADFLNNADLVYDSAAKTFFAVSDCHPNPVDAPNFISSHFRVTKCGEKTRMDSVTWESLATFGAEQTGFARNHNAGILRDAYGHLPNADYLTLYYTVSQTGDNSLWSYRIYDAYVALR